jgi:hypothetical protein
MMNRPHIWLLGLLALAMGAGYFFLHRTTIPPQHQSAPTPPDSSAALTPPSNRTPARNTQPSANAPLPPPGTPLKDTYAILAARARSGDRAASVRLFHDTAKCRYVDNFHRSLPLIMPMLLAITKPRRSADADKRSVGMLDTVQRKVDWVKKTEPLCDGADPASSRNSPDWMRIAAQQGDPEAIDCYLDQDFGDVTDAIRHLHWLGDFQRIGPEMASEAVANGDWKAVYLLASAYDGGNGMRWLDQAIAPNILQAYRYAILLDMGWPGQAYVHDRIQTLADRLSADEVTTAKEWAQDVFANRFHGRLANANDFQQVCPQPMAW